MTVGGAVAPHTLAVSPLTNTVAATGGGSAAAASRTCLRGWPPSTAAAAATPTPMDAMEGIWPHMSCTQGVGGGHERLHEASRRARAEGRVEAPDAPYAPDA